MSKEGKAPQHCVVCGVTDEERPGDLLHATGTLYTACSHHWNSSREAQLKIAREYVRNGYKPILSVSKEEEAVEDRQVSKKGIRYVSRGGYVYSISVTREAHGLVYYNEVHGDSTDEELCMDSMWIFSSKKQAIEQANKFFDAEIDAANERARKFERDAEEARGLAKRLELKRTILPRGE